MMHAVSWMVARLNFHARRVASQDEFQRPCQRGAHYSSDDLEKPKKLRRGMAKAGNKTRRRPTVSVVGAGRMGGALAQSLAARGYFVEAVLARTLSNARRVARLIQPQPI